MVANRSLALSVHAIHDPSRVEMLFFVLRIVSDIIVNAVASVSPSTEMLPREASATWNVSIACLLCVPAGAPGSFL